MKKDSLKKLILKASAVGLSLALGAGCVTTQLNKVSTVYAETSETTESLTLIDSSTVWSYYDGETDPAGDSSSEDYDAQAWAKLGYDDSSWSKATGAFGAKNGAVASLGGGYDSYTLLTQYYEGTTTDIEAYFFRTTINSSVLASYDLSTITSITGSLVYDDAAIVYLNGTKIASFDADGITSNMEYGGSNAGTPKTGDISLTYDDIKDLIVEGDNIIAVEIHQGRSSSSDIYFEFTSLEVDFNEEVETSDDTDTTITQKSVNLTVGSDETERNITWYADSSETGQLQVCKYAQLVSGAFPESGYTTIDVDAQVSNNSGYYYFQATISDLEENTKYAYRLINEDTVSQIYSFETDDFDGSYNFILAGDPQIGAGSTDTDTEGWAATLLASVNKFNPSFILSAGDQVNTVNSETQYDGYLENSQLTSVAQATTVGNHDTSSSSYSQHFNLPNVTSYGSTAAGSDYWYVYNNTLFMDLNSNNMSTAEHKTFMEEAIAANPDVTWTVVVFHHSIYSVASHAVDSDILQRRSEYIPVFDELNIDVVLMGHDHVYVRSNIMYGDEVVTDTTELSSVTNPAGTLYVTANSASGSKYYDIKTNVDTYYAAVMDQSYERSISNVEVSDTEFKITTYNYNETSGTWEQIDEFSIYKTDTTDLEELVLTVETISNADNTYTTESFNAFVIALNAANTVLSNEDATQDEIDSALAALQAAYDGLTTTTTTVDREELETLISQLEAIINAESTYTAESYEAYITALNTANEVLSDISATQGEINSAIKALQVAYDSLTEATTSDTADTDDTTTDTSSSSDDSTSSTTSSSSNVQTGDNTNALAATILLFTAAGCIVFLRKKKEND
ncbi:MAG: metallophosphoesterase [Erysipelotrichaceae bacterium]|nr:metallophosphoesterase [Erysipelotrichaceae bacterium]